MRLKNQNLLKPIKALKKDYIKVPNEVFLPSNIIEKEEIKVNKSKLDINYDLIELKIGKNTIELNENITIITEHIGQTPSTSWNNGWYICVKINEIEVNFYLFGVISGCGSGYIGSFSSYYWEDQKDLFIPIIKKILDYQKYTWGSIITTQGNSKLYEDESQYSTNYRLLLALGFECISTYDNNQHGDKQSQDLLQLILKK